MISIQPISNKSQTGAATLITSLIMLVAMTIITIFAARSALMEQKIYANEFRAKQAFEAAQAGLDYGISYVLAEGGADKDADDVIDTFALRTLTNSADYQITLTDNGGVNSTQTLVESTGRSDDDSATATISQLVVTFPALPTTPGNPVTARGLVNVSGTGDIVNPEGSSTIWSGSTNINFSGSGTTQIHDPSVPANDYSQPPVESSNSGGLGPDIISGDTNLSTLTGDQFFENFMGTDKASFKNSGSVREVAPADAGNLYNAVNDGLDLARDEIVWVDGNMSLSGSHVGCTVDPGGSADCATANIDPIILVVDGDLTINGNLRIYGVIYVTGNIVNANGTASIDGAAIVEGDVSGTGTLDITYNSSIVNEAANIARVAGNLAGSWRDF